MAGGYLGNIYNSQNANKNNYLLTGIDNFDNTPNNNKLNKNKIDSIIRNPAIGALIGVFSVVFVFLALFGLYKFIEYMKN